MNIKKLFLVLISFLFIANLAKASEITFWHSFTQPERVAGMEKIVAEFKDATGTTVNVEVVPWGKVREKWTAAAAAGTLPDVSICLVDVCSEMYSAGVSRSLQPAINLIGGANAFASAELLDRFNKIDGQFVSIPFYAHTRLIFYRKDIFEKYGVSKAPATWDEYIDVCKKINNPSAGEYAMLQMWNPSDWGAAIYYYVLARSNGRAILDKDGNSDLSHPDHLEVIKMMQTIYEECGGDLSMTFHDNLFEAFNNGKTAMVIDTMFVTHAIKNKRPELFDAGVVGIARPPTNKQTGWFADAAHITVLNGDNESMADKFVAFLYEDQRYIDYMHIIAGGMNPVTASAASNPAYLDNEHIAMFKEGVELTLEGIANGAALGATYGPNPTGFTAKSGVIENMMAYVVLGEKTPEEAQAWGHAELQKMVDKARR